MKQAEFAGLVGTDVPKQSYENDRRELRAEYLARLVEAEVDVVYVLTGRRSEAEWLGSEASELLSCYLTLPADLQRLMQELARSLRQHLAGPAGTTLHSGRLDYRAGDQA